MRTVLCFAAAMSVMSGLAQVAIASDSGATGLNTALRPACAMGSAQLVSDGDVLLSRGGSFAEVSSGTGLTEGDRLLVRDGFASVVVENTVVSRVGAGSMLMLAKADQAICVSEVKSNPDVVAQSGPDLAINPLFIAAGVAVVGGGIGAGVALSSKNSGNNFPFFPISNPLPPVSN